MGWGQAAHTGGMGASRARHGRVHLSVGSYPDGASPYGVLDMAGNIAELVMDWMDPIYGASAVPTRHDPALGIVSAYLNNRFPDQTLDG